MKENIAVKMVLLAWQSGVKNIDKILSELPDKDFDSPVAPGRNTAGWVIGHLAAVNDSLFEILGLGEKLNPAYEQYFLRDKKEAESPSASEIRKYWADTIDRLNKRINELSVDEWFQRHTLVSAEDFEKEPHRNKLNVLLSRATHIAHHKGQLVLL